MVGSLFLIILGCEKCLWKYFFLYGKWKVWYIIGLVGVLFLWFFIFILCLFCENNSLYVMLGVYYLLFVVLFLIFWLFVEDSYYLFMIEIWEENGKDIEVLRYVGDKFLGLWIYFFIISILNSMYCWNYIYYFLLVLIWEMNLNFIYFKVLWIKYSIVIFLVVC